MWLHATRTQPPHHTHTLNLLLSYSTKEFGLHHDRLFGEFSLPQNFVVAQSHPNNDRSTSSLVFGSICPCQLTDQGPQFVKAEALVPV